MLVCKCACLRSVKFLSHLYNILFTFVQQICCTRWGDIILCTCPPIAFLNRFNYSNISQRWPWRKVGGLRKPPPHGYGSGCCRSLGTAPQVAITYWPFGLQQMICLAISLNIWVSWDSWVKIWYDMWWDMMRCDMICDELRYDEMWWVEMRWDKLSWVESRVDRYRKYRYTGIPPSEHR